MQNEKKQNTKINNVHKFLLDAKINTTKTIIVIIFFVIVTSLIFYYFLRVPEITTILQNQPVSEWIPSLFKVGIEPALILAIILFSIELVLRVIFFILGVVYLPVFIYVVIKRFVNYLISTFKNKTMQKILTTNDKLEEVYAGPVNKLLECLGINDNPMWQVKKQMIENYYQNDKKFIDLNLIDYSACKNFNHLFDGLEDIPMKNFSKLRCHLAATDEDGKSDIIANEISANPIIKKNIFLNKNQFSIILGSGYFAKEIGTYKINECNQLVPHNKYQLKKMLRDKEIDILQTPAAFELFKKEYPDFKSICPYLGMKMGEVDIEWGTEKRLFEVLYGLDDEQSEDAVYNFIGLSSFPLKVDTFASGDTEEVALAKVLKKRGVS